jgi:hypothetical protein
VYIVDGLAQHIAEAGNFLGFLNLSWAIDAATYGLILFNPLVLHHLGTQIPDLRQNIVYVGTLNHHTLPATLSGLYLLLTQMN